MKKLIMFIGVLLLMGLNCYAQGDLTVNGTLNVGSGGISFPDGSVQTTSPLVWDETVTAATNILTSPTLDGEADGGYDFEILIENTSASGANYSLYANTDTTPANYRRYFIAGGVDPVANIAISNAVIGGATAANVTIIRGTVTISSAASGYKYNVSFSNANNGASNVQLGNMLRKNPLGSNLTSLTFSTPTANAIGANSRIRMWKKIINRPAAS